MLSTTEPHRLFLIILPKSGRNNQAQSLREHNLTPPPRHCAPLRTHLPRKLPSTAPFPTVAGTNWECTPRTSGKARCRKGAPCSSPAEKAKNGSHLLPCRRIRRTTAIMAIVRTAITALHNRPCSSYHQRRRYWHSQISTFCKQLVYSFFHLDYNKREPT